MIEKNYLKQTNIGSFLLIKDILLRLIEPASKRIMSIECKQTYDITYSAA
jgi:hypothetical protein